MPLKTYPIQPDVHGHRTRFSDSSFYDEVCVTCGATDAGRDLNGTCPKQVTDEEHAAERIETAKRQLIGEGSTIVHMLRLLHEKPTAGLTDFYVKEIGKVCDLVEVLLEERKKLNVTLKTQVNVDVGEALLKGKTPEEQEEMRQGFAQWFDIQRANKKSALFRDGGLVPPVSQMDIDATLSQVELDTADALDFGTSLKAVRMARMKYEGKQSKTRLFFMADWNKLARFKRRELVRTTL